MDDRAEMIRTLVRPIVTVLFSLSWIGATMYLILNDLGVSIPYILLTVLTWGVIVWYYDDRTFFHRHQSPLNIISNWGSKK